MLQNLVSCTKYNVFFPEIIKILRVDMDEEVCFLQFQFEISVDFVLLFNDNFFI